jgi:hypothetical protein
MLENNPGGWSFGHNWGQGAKLCIAKIAENKENIANAGGAATFGRGFGRCPRHQIPVV